jgi:predicted dehydrogenase
MRKHDIDEFVIGDDWVGKFDYLNDFTQVVYLERTEGISSTQLRLEKVQNIRLGIVGSGHDAKRFLNEIQFVKSASVEILYSQNEVDVKALSREYEIAIIADTYKNMLTSEIEAVYITSDINEHFMQIKMALEAGKHVLCENPLVVKDGEAEILFSLAKNNNKLLLMALKTAFAPAFNTLLEELKKGTLGKIKEIRSTFTSLYEERGYPLEYIQNGATNLLMSYPSLLIHKIAGKSKTLHFFDQKENGYDVSNRAISTHENDVIGLATVGVGMKSDGSAVISGTKGYVLIPAPWWLTKEFYFKFEDTHKEYHFEYEFEGDGLRYMISEFVTLIQRGEIESSRLTHDDMLELNKIIVQYNLNK